MRSFPRGRSAPERSEALRRPRNRDSIRRVFPGRLRPRPMAKPTHPAPREPGALSLLGLSTLCAVAAATLLLTGHPAGGGAMALAGAIAQWMARSASTARATLALGATGPLGDAAVL